MADSNQEKHQADLARRLAFSFIFGTVSVIVSTTFFIALDSNNPSTVTKILSYVCALPLLPGIGFVSAFFNEWQAVHGGQIALIPLVSLPVDISIILGIWTLLKRRKSAAVERHVTLHINQ